MALWANLPVDLLEQVVGRLNIHRDVFHFSHVCKSWRYFALDNRNRFPSKLPLGLFLSQPGVNPCLMLPSSDGSEYRSFFSISKQKMIGEFHLPETRRKWLCSTSFGWVLMVDFVGEPEDIILFNPLTTAQIRLPPLSTFPIYNVHAHRPGNFDYSRSFCFIEKGVLSADPSKDPYNWILMVIASAHNKLCFCRPGDENWTLVGGDPLDTPSDERLISDIIYHEVKFYAVNRDGVLLSCDVGPKGNSSPRVEILARPPVEARNYNAKYLVVSSAGDLLQVERCSEITQCSADCETYHTTRFDVFKLVKGEVKYKWNRLKSLGNDVLFLGRNASVCFSGTGIPNFRVNSIYFTDDQFFRLPYDPPTTNTSEDDDLILECRDSGIYRYEDGTTEDLINPSVMAHSLWIMLSPW